ncbi:leucyl aminopeptidase family protein [Candidatus Haliotispira prima]|uniref:Leucyl aminopeptidase family protein n=1 Tax=Candidatus Haliotispira prima TaxID=3034016 RepID=A0ABY8MH48_9SPIO|nr:leucyl aminopeptidase family protein [Candidatus Haliotispira prima]
MKFAIQKSLQFPDANWSGLILAKRASGEFPEIAEIQESGLEQKSLDRIIEYFQKNKVDKKTGQHDYSTLATGEVKTLPLHLSNICLRAKARELGGESAALLQWGRGLAKMISQQKWQRIALPVIPGLDAARFRLVLEGLWFGSYRFGELKEKDDEKDPTLTIIVDTAQGALSERVLENMVADIAKQTTAMQQTLKLVLSPANICTPEFFSDFAAKQAGALPDVQSEIWGEDRLEKEDMNLILAVGRGSPRESRLLILNYCGDNTDNGHIALVGKGVCFDTGGTNLKPSGSIKGMQYDMMGGAIVYGAFHYLADSGIKANIKAYIPLVENQIGGKAIKTGDIITSAMGPTVEINNTDAEGRLILADAIHYAVRQKPRLLLDCATLTGAAIMALGEQCAAYYSNDDEVAELFAQAGRETGEDVWRMPLFRPYVGYLKSKLADISNISTKGSGGGSLTAALFIEKFALQRDDSRYGEDEAGEEDNTKISNEETPPHAWLHLDMAGWSGSDEHPSLGENSRALGVRLLSNFVRRYLAGRHSS